MGVPSFGAVAHMLPAPDGSPGRPGALTERRMVRSLLTAREPASTRRRGGRGVETDDHGVEIDDRGVKTEGATPSSESVSRPGTTRWPVLSAPERE
jgi:hypothetical protein